ncbi:xylulokinase [Mycobacterium sp. URHB0021]
MDAPTCLLGIDIGTTAVKAILIDAAGAQLAAVRQPVPMSRPGPGCAEQDPDDWIRGVIAALTECASRYDLSGLVGIGVCSQVNTHVFVGSNNDALIPAITWQDTRCADDAADLDAQVSAAQKTAWFGGPIPIDASHALARMVYVARMHPDVYGKTRHVLLPKDYCVLRLTGAVTADAIAAVGLAGPNGYVGELLDLVPRAHELLPALHGLHHIAGRVLEGLPCAGTPVVVGAMDAWAGMFGVGVVDDGDAMYQSGTSEILGIVSSAVFATPGVILFPPYENIVLHAGPTQSGGAALEWFSTLLGMTPAQATLLASQASPSDAVPLFLPHLQGERAPVWDGASRGAFARMDSRAGSPEMTRSVMEGVSFSARWVFEALQKSSGVSLSVANIGGGGSRADVWCQIRADTLGFALRRAAVPNAAALGAAILAGLGCGMVTTLREAVRDLVTFDRVFEPQAANRGYYDDKFGHFRALYEALQPVNARYRT